MPSTQHRPSNLDKLDSTSSSSSFDRPISSKYHSESVTRAVAREIPADISPKPSRGRRGDYTNTLTAPQGGEPRVEATDAPSKRSRQGLRSRAVQHQHQRQRVSIPSPHRRLNDRRSDASEPFHYHHVPIRSKLGSRTNRRSRSRSRSRSRRRGGTIESIIPNPFSAPGSPTDMAGGNSTDGGHNIDTNSTNASNWDLAHVRSFVDDRGEDLASYLKARYGNASSKEGQGSMGRRVAPGPAGRQWGLQPDHDSRMHERLHYRSRRNDQNDQATSDHEMPRMKPRTPDTTPKANRRPVAGYHRRYPGIVPTRTSGSTASATSSTLTVNSRINRRGVPEGSTLSQDSRYPAFPKKTVTVTSQPLPLASMSELLNHDLLEEAEEPSRVWSSGLSGFCDGGWSKCCLGMSCPCILYSRNKERSDHMRDEGMPLEEPPGTCTSDCMAYAVLSLLCFAWPLQISNRAQIRDQFDIQGSCLSDCVAVTCCSPCALAQESRELSLEERELRLTWNVDA